MHTWAKKVLRSRVVTWLTWPPFGVALYVGVIVGTHLTGFMNLVLANDNVHNAEHALYLIAGYLYFLPLLGGADPVAGLPIRPGSSCSSWPCPWMPSPAWCSDQRKTATRFPAWPTTGQPGHRAR